VIEDVTPFFTEFADTAIVNGVEVPVIFDAKREDAFGMSGPRPAIAFPSAPSDSYVVPPLAAVGDLVAVGGASYVIAEIDRSDPAVTVAILREV